jgi:Arc/MetJ-type ribon-helix-helix transcriptional regulator
LRGVVWMNEVKVLRSKMSVTIDVELIKWIEQQVTKQKFRNKSHAVEYALVKLKESEK